ncbi:MAG: aminotransferase class V-fold PLP-dependent enzyme [Alphaproteobacteria bacterium]
MVDAHRSNPGLPPATGAVVPPVYLDHQATTPVDPRVLDAMLPYFSDRFGNPHSVQHRLGWQAAEAIEEARAQVGGLIGAGAREIVFTSGATESNNLAVKGAARFLREHNGLDHVINAETEHKCVVESCRDLVREGFRVTSLPVRADGLIELGALANAIDDKTALVSVMAVNNEIGVIQPLEEIGRMCGERGVLFHTDAAQAIGKIPIDVEAMGIDLLSISGHKTYGPKGIGALYVRRRPRVRLTPLLSGGGQERGHRSGTLPTPLCVGLGTACAIAAEEMAAETRRLAGLRDSFVEKLAVAIPDLAWNGARENRVAGNLNLLLPGADGEDLVGALDDVAISTGSACTSATVEPSYVLRAIGLDDEQAASSVRVGFGRFTTEAEVDYAARRIGEVAARLRGETSGPAAVGHDRPTAAE